MAAETVKGCSAFERPGEVDRSYSIARNVRQCVNAEERQQLAVWQVRIFLRSLRKSILCSFLESRLFVHSESAVVLFCSGSSRVSNAFQVHSRESRYNQLFFGPKGEMLGGGVCRGTFLGIAPNIFQPSQEK